MAPTEDILADLTPAQREAVTHVEGPLLVVAGPGSGKTRVITRRVAYLIARGIAPRHILAVTFTNKAANEMKQRIKALGTPAGATIGTFHALCARLLREFADQARLPRSFTIYDQDDQLRCVRQAMERCSLSAANFPPPAVLAAISRAKNALVDPVKYGRQAEGFFQQAVAEVYPAYQRILAENDALDFDDLLMRTALLIRDKQVRQLLSDRYRYILIDEYQDTNHAQYVIAHGIALEHENICATGDPDQSIYGWRGADINNILEFEKNYPDALVVRLEANYRSTAPILRAASNLIAHNRRRKRKALVAVRPGGTDVEVIRCQDEHAEAAEVARIVSAQADAGIPYREMAVFYRVNALSRVLEEAFRRAGIPYQIARGVEFYNRKEIKDVLAYLRLLVNPNDDLSCRRVINVPPRGIGAVTLRKLTAAAEAAGGALLAACRDPAAAGLGRSAAAKVAGFARLIGELAALPRSPVLPIVEAVVGRSGLEDYLSRSEDDRQALRNVQEMVSAAAEFDADNPGATLEDYLQQVALISDVDAVDTEAGAVTFMTLHAAKGLEFAVVVMVGCEDGLLPFGRPEEGKSGRDIEEERRLAFVGMTRAKDRLFLTCAKYRMLRGRTCRQVPSPFLREIGDESVRWLDKSDYEPAPRRRPVDLETYLRRRELGDERDERALAEALDFAEVIPERFAALRPGRRVRHRKFGPGRIQAVSYDGRYTRAVVRFDHAGTRTLILEMAGLEPL